MLIHGHGAGRLDLAYKRLRGDNRGAGSYSGHGAVFANGGYRIVAACPGHAGIRALRREGVRKLLGPALFKVQFSAGQGDLGGRVDHLYGYVLYHTRF